MRKDAKEERTIEIKRLNAYHYGHFEKLTFFNSDRPVYLTSDYKVSSNNTKSVLSIIKEGKEIAGYGIEWEMMCTSTQNKTVVANLLSMIFEKVFPADLFKMEEDCTVNAECISQVMSKAFIRNHYKDFKACYSNYFPAFGITTDHVNCGMHVNLSLALLGKNRDEQIENARKLGYLINANYDFFRVAFARKLPERGMTNWCPPMDKRMTYWKNTSLYDFPVSHSSCCVNMAHVGQGRLEIRLVGGQESYACFRNTMEVIFHVIDRISKTSWNDCTNLAKLFKDCNQHCYDRLTRCRTQGVLPQEVLDKITPTVKPVDWE